MSNKNEQEIKRQLFGTDGMRGRANEGAMSAEVALQLGRQ